MVCARSKNMWEIMNISTEKTMPEVSIYAKTAHAVALRHQCEQFADSESLLETWAKVFC